MKTDLGEILTFFQKKEPKLAEIIKEIKFEEWFDVEKDSNKYFYDLCRTIVGQQLAGKAATAIFSRFEKLFSDLTPENILHTNPETLRNAGLSWAKVRSIQDLADKVVKKELILADLENLESESLILELSKVKGIGRWTAEMFLMFRLGREDVFSLGDLGLKNGLKKYLGVEEISKDEISEYTNNWAPYRTYGAIAMWHLLDNR